MVRSLLLMLAASALFAVEPDPWAKVKDLKSGSDIRLTVAGMPSTVEGKFDELRDEVIVVVVKNEQKAFKKEQVARVDYRPKGGAMTPETKVKQTDPDPTPPVGMNHGPNVPGQSVSSGLSVGKPGWETIYRKASHGAPKPEAEKK